MPHRRRRFQMGICCYVHRAPVNSNTFQIQQEMELEKITGMRYNKAIRNRVAIPGMFDTPVYFEPTF